jgi:hypothetical protein
MTSFQLFDFDNFEVHGCVEVNSGGYEYTEQCDDKDATFWTVYGHYSPESGEQGVEALVDCTDKRSAEIVQGILKGLRQLLTDSEGLVCAIEIASQHFDTGLLDEIAPAQIQLTRATNAARKAFKIDAVVPKAGAA